LFDIYALLALGIVMIEIVAAITAIVFVVALSLRLYKALGIYIAEHEPEEDAEENE
jgi:hypothetical protein